MGDVVSVFFARDQRDVEENPEASGVSMRFGAANRIAELRVRLYTKGSDAPEWAGEVFHQRLTQAGNQR